MTVSATAPAQNAVAGMLNSPALSALWARHYISRRDANPIPDTAADIHAAGDNIASRPDLLAFMNELVALERGALGHPQKDEDGEIKELRVQLEGLARYLTVQSEDISLPRREELPKPFQQILTMMERQTGQGPGPVRATLRLMKDFAAEIYEEAKEHPAPFYSSAAFCGAMIAFMNWRIGTPQTSRMDPELAATTNFSLDALDDPDFVPKIDYSLLETFQPSCHDHLAMLLGQSSADFIKDTLDTANLFPQHCIGVKDLAFNAQSFQQNLWNIYDGWNARMHPVIKGLADTVGGALPDSKFNEAFTWAADHTEDIIYSANWLENMTLHTVITAGAFMAYRKLRTMDSEERRELGRNVRDFLHRTTRAYPLAYLLSASGSTYAYMATHGAAPHTLWAGIGAGLSGLMIHKFAQRAKAPAFVRGTTITVRDKLARFADPAAIVSDARAGEPLTEDKSRLSGWTKAALTVGGTGAAITADFALAGGQTTGATLGATSVVVPFLYYNVPEDATLHWIFSIIGTGLAMAWEDGLMRPAKAVGRLFSKYTGEKSGPADKPEP